MPTNNTNNKTNSTKQSPSVTRLFLGFLVVAAVLWTLPIVLGNHVHEKPNPEAIFRVFVIASSIVVGLGFLADLFLNPNDRQIIGEKRSGLSRIASKYNQQVKALKAEYQQEKRGATFSGTFKSQSLLRTYSNRYDAVRNEYFREYKDFIEYWRNSHRRYTLFGKIWGWILVTVLCGAVFSCTYSMDVAVDNCPETEQAAPTYWNASNIVLPHLTDGTQYVSNPDSVLSASTVSRINERMLQLDNELGIETAVIVVNHIENDDPFRFAQDVGNNFGVGRQDRGLVIVVGYQDHSINMSPGRSLEADLTDAECYRLQQRYVIPGMKAEQPDSAMLYLAEGLYALLKDKPLPDMNIERPVKDESMALGLYFWFFVGLLVLTMYLERKFEWLGVYGTMALMSNPFVASPTYVSTGNGGFGSSSGGGFGGGGFGGGYGGGSFGGGGATSRW
ncbi:MAG: TPM domain-containing protein [Prevotella sp.]|nr:TPM domain-containing protein [Prevotella sp.]